MEYVDMTLAEVYFGERSQYNNLYYSLGSSGAKAGDVVEVPYGKESTRAGKILRIVEAKVSGIKIKDIIQILPDNFKLGAYIV